MKTVIPFSGGLDSTYTLWWFLHNTTDNITAYFIDERYLTNSFNVSNPMVSPYSRIRVMKLVSELQKIRPFELKIVNVYGFKPDETKEIWLLRHIMPQINDGTYDKVSFALGDVGAKFEETNSELDEIPRVYVALEREFANTSNRGELHFHYIQENETRVHAFVNLPENIKSLTLSCNNPQIRDDGNFINCGKCKKCQHANLMQSCLSSGKTLQETIEAYEVARHVSNQRKKFLNTGGIWSRLSS